PSLSLLLAVRAVRATAGRGYVVEEALDAVHWALQESTVAYPTANVPFAVRPGPDGRRGVPLIPVGDLVALAERAAARALTDEECQVYLHLAACPATTSTAALRALPVRVGAGVVPMERLAAASLAGTRVDVASALPVDLVPLLTPLIAESGVSVTVAAVADDDLVARLDAGTVPDLAIIARPRTMASLASRGRLVEIISMVDVEKLRARAGDELIHLATVGADGAWPAAAGSLYGAPVAIEASSLVWYPAAAFREAGYVVPATLSELDRLSAAMVADGRTPWCLGLEDEGPAATGTAAEGPAAGPSGPDFVEELVLREAGSAAYDAWTSGSLGFTNSVVRDAFEHFGRLVLRDERVLTGTGSITEIPRSQAPLPLFSDPPLCWLYRATGSERATVTAARRATLGIFAFPSAAGLPAGAMRGRAYEIVVFRDRPEVRRLVEELLGDRFSASATAGFVDAGVWPVGAADPAYRPDALAAAERDLLARAIAAGSFRVDATDLLPEPVERRFARAIVAFLERGAFGLREELREIVAAWPRDP
ncbi:MAG: extracellular solute-binding protein, partial [Chloroflexi bacterium]|nr:extracellular solute-binding protein [Chloroflexota bacterium]